MGLQKCNPIYMSWYDSIFTLYIFLVYFPYLNHIKVAFFSKSN